MVKISTREHKAAVDLYMTNIGMHMVLASYTVKQVLHQLKSRIQLDIGEKEDYLREVPSTSNKRS